MTLPFAGAAAAMGGAAGIFLSVQSIFAENFYPNQAQAGYILLNTGQAQRQANFGVTNISGEWMDPLGWDSAANYEVRTTHVSGTNIGGHGTWAALSTTRTRSTTVGGGTTDASLVTTFLVEIRMAASPFTVLASANITLSLQYWGIA